MSKIKHVIIDGFWGDKTVKLKFNKDANFLIGVNGSGKTTIINIIAASLNADFSTLDKAQFNKIRIDFFEEGDPMNKQSESYIEIEKTDKENSPYSNITFKIKFPNELDAKTFKLNELEEENLFRYQKEYFYHKSLTLNRQFERDVNIALKNLVNLTWLSIHRTSNTHKNNEDKSFESTIDQKIKELSIDLVRYFGMLDRNYSIETEKFQKNIFLSLIEEESTDGFTLKTDNLDSAKEKESLRQIFLLFKLQEFEFRTKLDKHYKTFEKSKDALLTKDSLNLKQFASLVSTKRIHSIVQEWIILNEKKTSINKQKLTFIDEVNSLLQRKKLFINERNELLIETTSGKIFSLFQLSSGEKQLLIILGQSLLQENNNHIYIADEPELSLHVEWQEKLVSSLKKVNPNSQIIFATHSPDIVGSFSKSIIKVENHII